MTGFFSLMFISSRISILAFGDLHAHAAVDRQAGTSDETRLVGAKENNGVSHVADLAQPAKRRLLDDRGDGSADVRCESCGDYVVGQLHAHIGGDKPGIETVDPHAVTKLARFHRGDPRHAVNSRFGAGVSSNGRDWGRGRDRGNIDDGAAGTCTSARSHRAKRMFHAETGSDDIDVTHPAQILSLKIDDE